MTREEAIKLLDGKNSFEALTEIEYYNGFNGLEAQQEAISEACVLAVAALREQEERSKGCRWCWHFQNDPQYLVSKGNGMYDEVIFKFCPVCGKKLEVEG